MSIFAIIGLIVQILGALPTVIKLVREIFALLRSKPPAVQAEVKNQVAEILSDAKKSRTMGIEPNKEKLQQSLQDILDRLRKASNS